jgi:hypothetical protein
LLEDCEMFRIRHGHVTSLASAMLRMMLEGHTLPEIPVYGEQEQSSYNGHFESTCYRPLLMFNGEGD